MKQQDVFKITVAAFLALTMVFSIFAYFFIGPRSDIAPQPDEQQQEKYNPEFWVINQPFNSISDPLNMTPPGAVTASYMDIESMTPQMIQWARSTSPLNEADSIYRSNTTRMFYAVLKEGNNTSFLLLSTMFPEKNDFDYIRLPEDIPILIRQEQQYNGLYNIMGYPTIFAPPQTAIDVLQIIYSLNKTATAYDQYKGMLRIVDPSPYQIINSSVNFADQFYMGISENKGSYERTTAYLNLRSSTLKKLNQLKANSTQKGFAQYNITRSGNYTIVKITGNDLFRLLNEESS